MALRGRFPSDARQCNSATKPLAGQGRRRVPIKTRLPPVATNLHGRRIGRTNASLVAGGGRWHGQVAHSRQMMLPSSPTAASDTVLNLAGAGSAGSVLPGFGCMESAPSGAPETPDAGELRSAVESRRGSGLRLGSRFTPARGTLRRRGADGCRRRRPVGGRPQ